MAITHLPTDINGSIKQFPYLARITSEHTHYTSIILLIEEDKHTILSGKYSGNLADLKERYKSGNILSGSRLISDCNLVPLNMTRKEVSWLADDAEYEEEYEEEVDDDDY